MAMTISARLCSTQACSFSLFGLTTRTRPRLQTRRQSLPLSSSTSRIHLPKLKFSDGFPGFSAKNLGFSFGRGLRLCAGADNGEGGSRSSVDEVEEARGQSTMPERFRHLAKEAPDRPIRWPWFIVLAFLLYAWRTVLWELYNWRKAVLGIFSFMGYLFKLALAFIFHFIGDPITSFIRCIEDAIYTVRSFYSSVVAYAPVSELTVIIVLASAVLAVAEATAPESVNSQPYLLTVSGLVGFAAVKGFVSELLFWLLLLGLFGFARFVKKRDYVSSVLPAAAVLAAIGEPWIRVVVMILYTALAISHHSKRRSEGNEKRDIATSAGRPPLPLLGVALAIGIHLAVKWAGYRHLTWMIV
ncbi:uncharacterized protein LOC131147983 [Malania oleifera]|uniref:uncharacterized protein LOC131147983 n=1 Tax=Malania oleifera TaxID=397392 RepID=UPI0025AEC3D9|nr:uncharacterized protein LOC131147983 [Malania oleifera]